MRQLSYVILSVQSWKFCRSSDHALPPKRCDRLFLRVYYFCVRTSEVAETKRWSGWRCMWLPSTYSRSREQPCRPHVQTSETQTYPTYHWAAASMWLNLSRPPSKLASVNPSVVVMTRHCTGCSARACHPSLYWKRTLPTTLDACKLECVVLFNVCVSVIQPLSYNQVTLPEKVRSYSIVHCVQGNLEFVEV